MAQDDRQAAQADRRTLRAGVERGVLRQGPAVDLCAFLEISLAVGRRRPHRPRRHGDPVRGYPALPALHGTGGRAIWRWAARRRDTRAALARVRKRAETFRHPDRGAEMMTRLLAPFERMLDALTGERRERNVVWLLVAYCAAWSLYGALAKGSQDIHFDMGEMVAWSRDAGIGTPKHPPIAAWLVGVWFKAFPQQDWAYYLFAMVLATFALWIAWRVSEGYLEGEKRIAGLLLITFIPFFNFHALKY